MTALYRSTLDVARADLRTVLEREAVVLEKARPLAGLEARRWSRIVFGVGLLLHAPAMALSAALGSRHSAWPSVNTILAAAFPISLAWGWLAHRLALRHATRALERLKARNQHELAPSAESDPFALLAVIQARSCPARERIAFLSSVQKAALLLPLFGFCLLAPLAMHLYVYAAIRLPRLMAGANDISDFETWIGMSIIFVGVAHASLLVYAAWFTGQLSLRTRETMPSRLRPVYVATMASAVPGIIFVFAMGLGLLPMLLTFVTGRIFLPWLFDRATRAFFEEGAEVAQLENALPPLPVVSFNEARFNEARFNGYDALPPR